MNWTAIPAVAFAVVFLVVGIIRIVEFDNIGLSKGGRVTSIALHLVGCILFTSAMSLFALDPEQEYKKATYGLFAVGLLLLLPVHIYAALKRRLRVRELVGDTEPSRR